MVGLWFLQLEISEQSIPKCSKNKLILFNYPDNSGTGVGIHNNDVISLSWVAPTEREDNSALSLSEIACYSVTYSLNW